MNIKSNIIYILLAIILLQNIAFCQENEFEELISPKEIIPPSPSSSLLGKYAEIPVGLFTGVPNITIPIFEVALGKTSLPISLNYHSSGTKVSETSSIVGLGWSLNAGGVITRSINGIADDFDYHIGYTNSGDYYGYLHDPNPNIQDIANPNKKRDGQPDIFYFNFCGQSGKFFFSDTGEAKFVKQNNWKLQTIFDEDGSIDQFIITIEDGTKYYFTESERTNSISTGGKSVDTKSAWFLTKITSYLSSTNVEEIEFQYFEEELFDFSVGSRKYKKEDAAGPDQINDYHQFIKTKRIEKISWPNGHIDFIYNFEREDILKSTFEDVSINNEEHCKALSEINIYDKETELYKSYELVHDYFEESESNNRVYLTPGESWENYHNLLSTDFLKKRIKLTSLVEKFSLNENKQLPPYKFTYDETPLPSRDSYEVDYWGYYNNNEANTFKPILFYYPNMTLSNTHISPLSIYPIQGQSTELMGGDADRSPNTDVIQAGVLKKIIYPMKGNKIFHYEPNTFLFDGENRIGGGIRIKSIEKNYSNSEPPVTTHYDYNHSDDEQNSSGRIVFLPQFGDEKAYCSDDEHYNGVIYSNCLKGLGTVGGSFVGYKEVSVNEVGQGKTHNKFDFPIVFGEEPNSVETVGVIYERPVVEYEIPENWEEWEIAFYPYAPEPNYDWNRGQLLEKTIYDEAGNLIEKTEYVYHVKSYDKTNGILVKPIWESYDEYFYIYANYYYLTGWKTLVSKTITEYLSPSLTKTYELCGTPLTKKNHKIISNNSDGSQNITYELYPNSYHKNSDSYVGSMLSMNNINKPIEIVKAYKNNNKIYITDGRIYEYCNSFPCHIIGEYRLLTNKPIPLSEFKFSNQLSIGVEPFEEQPDYFSINDIDIHYSDKLDNIILYNENGYISSIETIDQLTSIIISNTNHKPLVIGKNLSYTQLCNAILTSGQVSSINEFQSLTYKIDNHSENNRWNAIIEHLLTSFPDAEFSFFGYDPLRGLSRMVDVNGTTTYYEYDEFHRLKSIIDEDGNILKHHKYHYIEDQQ